MRLFEVSGTCTCGLFTKVPDYLHLTGSEEDRVRETLLFLCHHHEGDHTFQLGEGETPHIVPYVTQEERRRLEAEQRSTSTTSAASREEGSSQMSHRTGHRPGAKPGSRQARRERQHARQGAAVSK